MFKEYTEYDALGLAELVKKQEVSAKELLEAAVAQVNALNPKLNAVIDCFDDHAFEAINRGLPSGPFHGVPFLIKDLNFVLKGERLTMGSRGVNAYPDYDSHMVQRFKAAGLNIFGKTNTPELGLMITTEPKAHGPAHNPFKQGYSTGGSSGGSACAVSAGMVPMAGGGDGGGSIRFPSSWCGVFGFKPSRGRTPIGPDQGELWQGAVIDHVLTRSVRDSAAMLDVTHGPEPGSLYHIAPPQGSFLEAALRDPKPLRIGLSTQPLIEGTLIDLDVKQGLHNTVKALEAMGHTVVEHEPLIDIETCWKHFMVINAAYTAQACDNIRAQYGRAAAAKMEAATQNIAAIGRSLRAHDVIAATEAWHKIQLAMSRYFESCDVMLCPTVHTPSVKHGILPTSSIEDALMHVLKHLPLGRMLVQTGLLRMFGEKMLHKMAFTILGNITGLPSMSVPLHMSKEGLPIGMQFIAPMCDEETLFSLAGQLERAQLFTAPAFKQ